MPDWRPADYYGSMEDPSIAHAERSRKLQSSPSRKLLRRGSEIFTTRKEPNWFVPRWMLPEYEEEYDEAPAGYFLGLSLRKFVFLFAIFVLVHCIVGVTNLLYLTDGGKVFAQGYSQKAEVVVIMLGMFGLIFAWVAGFMGVMDADANRVRVFLVFCWVKVLFMLGLFIADCVSLSHCGSLDGKIHYKAALNKITERIAANQQCKATLSWYIGIFVPNLIYHLFGLVATWRLLKFYMAPGFLITFKKDPIFVMGNSEKLTLSFNQTGS